MSVKQGWIETAKAVYMIGIGGIGMSALARYFKGRNIRVSGYDKTETALTQQLIEEGIEINYTDDPAKAPTDVDVVIYTPAIPAGHLELKYYRDHHYPVLKRSEVLEEISKSSFNICIAGTHGKTTISTMVAHLLRDSGYGCNAFLGGIAANYNSNFWADPNNCAVMEADEFDRSFLRLHPDVAIISAIDADHLDIYGDASQVEEAFIDFSKRLSKDGLLITKKGLSRENDFIHPRHWTYSRDNESATVYAKKLRVESGRYYFDATLNGVLIEDLCLPMGGLHNVENCLAAIAVAEDLKISHDKIRAALLNFKGVRRRFEYIVRTDAADYIDDYAHHPEELNALISGVRSLYKNEKLVLLFQPHLFTRTRDFADGFAEALDRADEVVLLPIYPARELPIDGITTEWLTEKMKNANRSVVSLEQVPQWVKEKLKSETEKLVIVTAGAGNIDTLITPIKEILTTKN